MIAKREGEADRAQRPDGANQASGSERAVAAVAALRPPPGPRLEPQMGPRTVGVTDEEPVWEDLDTAIARLG